MMNPRNVIIPAMLLVLFLSLGCIEPAKQLGCCKKDNATVDSICMLYNMTDYEYYDLSEFTDSCNDSDRGTDGHCNVSINGLTGEDGEYHLIPICTEDMLGDCFYPDCRAMVCGDFEFTPRLAPGFTSADDATDQVPPETEEEHTKNFYEAQCRFLDMDTRLRNTMKNSNSEINVFRIGIGKDFQEFDQYRYYFPISDRYCGVRMPSMTTGSQSLRVDRYMNYLGPDGQYNPLDMNIDCLIDSEDVPPPFQFGYSNLGETTGFTSEVGGLDFDYSITDPDHYGYKFKQFTNIDIEGNVDEIFSFGFDEDNLRRFIDYKKIDKDYYRKELALAYSDYVLGEGGRAPFECDAGMVDCYSGDCDTSFYNRGLLLAGDNTSNSNTWDEVSASCTLEHDNLGNDRIICMPTVDFDDSANSREFASARFTPWLMKIDLDSYDYDDFVNQDDVASEDIYGCCGEKWCYEDTSTADGCRNLDGEWICDILADACRCEFSGVSPDKRFENSASYEDNSWGKAHACQLRWEWTDITGRGWYNLVDLEDEEAYPRWRGHQDGYLKEKDAFEGSLELSSLPEDFGYNVEYAEVESSEPCPDGYYLEEDAEKCYQPYASGVGFSYPPVAKIEFFGEFGEDSRDNVEFTGSELLAMGDEGRFIVGSDYETENFTILGYALLGEEELEDTYLYHACDLSQEPTVDGYPVNKDYTVVSIEDPTDPIIRFVEDPDGTTYTVNNFDRLMAGFLPYFENRIENLRNAPSDPDSGDRMVDGDIVLTSVPWIVALKRGDMDDGVFTDDAKFMTSPLDVYLERNLLDKETPESYSGSSSDDLKLNNPGDSDAYYTALTANEVALFFDRNGDKRLGSCVLDSNGLPEIKTFGWCNPCTVSTLAKQKIEKEPELSYYYLPLARIDLESSRLVDNGPLCAPSAHGIKCGSDKLRDISVYDYNFFNEEQVSAITRPEAAFMKEKLEIYMRSGIQPILDMSEEDYWEHTDYDALLDNKGAMIVIVENIDHTEIPSQIDQETVMDRASKIRLRCPRCMTAVAIRAEDNDTFREGIDALFADPRMNMMVDMIAIDDYDPIWGIEHDRYDSNTTGEMASEVVNDMASYSKVSLERSGKPTVITGFSVSKSESDFYGGSWGKTTYDTLFQTIVMNQDMLVKSGIYGIVFEPVRTDFSVAGGLTGVGADAGLVDTAGGIGEKGEKFCALEQAGNLMTQTPKTAMFTGMIQQERVNCTECTSLEKAYGMCDFPEAVKCDNGVECAYESREIGDVRCPDNTLVKPETGNCQLCSDLDGLFVCDYHYTNGSIETRRYESSDVVSSAYADVLGGLEKPEKCCILAENGEENYLSYAKIIVPHSVNRPMVFSESGNQDMDCGVTGSGLSTEETAFCGYQLPVKDYDVNCTFLEGEHLPSDHEPVSPLGIMGGAIPIDLIGGED